MNVNDRTLSFILTGTFLSFDLGITSSVLGLGFRFRNGDGGDVRGEAPREHPLHIYCCAQEEHEEPLENGECTIVCDVM